MKSLHLVAALAAGVILGVAADRLLMGRTVAAASEPVRQPPAPAPAPAAPTPSPSTAAKIPLRPDDPVRGPEQAKVTVVLFSDFQCPFCARVEPTLQALQAAFPGAIRVAWKHQPLSFHPNALPAARAAEGARAQGKFWELHDKLFANQAGLSGTLYAQSARELGLDLVRFERDSADERATKRIAEDQALAFSVGAEGTPTAFVNCRKVVGAQPVESFKSIVKEEIVKADALLAKGVRPGAELYERLCADNVAAAPQVAAGPARVRAEIAIRPDDPARGPARAPVTVVEFSDFQCPFCSRAVPAVRALESSLGKDVRLVWKHLPLSSLHPNALPAALAAEAAREQGKFWEMHDMLFANQAALSAAAYEQYARELGLDLARFRAAMQAPTTRARVQQDLEGASAAGVTGTPTFVVDGEIVLGSSALDAAVRRHLAAR